jgi:PTH1 family peptidyl-tRNA hydrolase
MILIVGLGNPGTEYVLSRHNFGYMALDAIALSTSAEFHHDNAANAALSDFHQAGSQTTKVLLLKPETFMNLSGQSVQYVARYYKIEPKNIWVIADDLDLPLGKIRVRYGGDSAGHNGLKSITEALGSEDYGRIRLGVRGDALRQEHIENQIDAKDFIMHPFESREQQFVDKTLAQVVMVVHESVANGELKSHTWTIDGFDESSTSLT